MTTIYGIRNCDTMKKAMKWLDDHGVAYRFHDYRQDGPPAQRLPDWIATLGWEQVVNRRGTSWRQLPEEVRQNLDSAGALAAARANPSLIRRPILEKGTMLLAGFDPDLWARELKR